MNSSYLIILYSFGDISVRLFYSYILRTNDYFTTNYLDYVKKKTNQNSENLEIMKVL